MHISDGVLSPPVWIGSYLITIITLALTTRKMPSKDIPKIAVLTSCFFVASLIHIPFGPTSIHLILNGLLGIILGRFAFGAIFLGVSFQTLIFQHGGVTTIGANSIIIGIPSLLGALIFRLEDRFNFKFKELFFATLAGGGAIFGGAFLLSLLLSLSGEEFKKMAFYALYAHIPLMIIESLITLLVVYFLLKVKPEILRKRYKIC
jgi:cobalt/nickel transport system permease protein